MNPFQTVISTILGGENSPVNKLIGLIPNVNERAAAKEEFLKESLALAAAQNMGQLEVNKVEAASASMFVSGWRPSVGWVCSFAMAYQFILQPLAGYVISIYSTYSAQDIPPIPTLDTASLMTVLAAMLGLGGMRSFEKYQGVSRESLTETPKTP